MRRPDTTHVVWLLLLSAAAGALAQVRWSMNVPLRLSGRWQYHLFLFCELGPLLEAHFAHSTTRWSLAGEFLGRLPAALGYEGHLQQWWRGASLLDRNRLLRLGMEGRDLRRRWEDNLSILVRLSRHLSCIPHTSLGQTLNPIHLVEAADQTSRSRAPFPLTFGCCPKKSKLWM